MSLARSPNLLGRGSRLAIAALIAGLALGPGGVGPGRADAAPTADPVLGAGKVQADFDGDGFGDLAVLASTTYDEVQDRHPFGSVTILYGSAGGLSTTGRQRIVGTDLPGMATQRFPFNPGALVAGDFNGDGASELAIGWRRGRAGSTNAAGVAETDDAFGRRLAAGNFDGRRKADLAVPGLTGDRRQAAARGLLRSFTGRGHLQQPDPGRHGDRGAR